MSNWKHARARDYLPEAKRLFGSPTFIANVPDGMAYWKMRGNNLFFDHTLRDENVKHCVPKPHHDFFYSTIKLYVPPEKLEDVLSISGSISYDGLKHLLSARCGGIGANIATLYLGAKVANDEYSIEEVKSEGLYVSYIRGEAMDHTEMKKDLRRLRTNNHRWYEKELKLAYYPLAFEKC